MNRIPRHSGAFIAALALGACAPAALPPSGEVNLALLVVDEAAADALKDELLESDGALMFSGTVVAPRTDAVRYRSAPESGGTDEFRVALEDPERGYLEVRASAVNPSGERVPLPGPLDEGTSVSVVLYDDPSALFPTRSLAVRSDGGLVFAAQHTTAENAAFSQPARLSVAFGDEYGDGVEGEGCGPARTRALCAALDDDEATCVEVGSSASLGDGAPSLCFHNLGAWTTVDEPACDDGLTSQLTWVVARSDAACGEAP